MAFYSSDPATTSGETVYDVTPEEDSGSSDDPATTSTSSSSSTSTSTQTGGEHTYDIDDSVDDDPALDYSSINDPRQTAEDTTGTAGGDVADDPVTTTSSESSGSTSEFEESIDNKAAAVIDLQTSGAGNVDEQLQGGTTTDQILGDVEANPEVTRELAEMTAIGDATLAVPGSVEDQMNEAQNQLKSIDWGAVATVAGAIGAIGVGAAVLGD